MRRLSLILLLPFAALVACGGGVKSSLVLDRSVGPVRLKEPRTQVERDLGKGTPLPPRGGAERVFYPKPDLTVWYFSKAADTPVEVIQITSSRYHTVGGVSVGTSYAKLRAVPGVKCFGPNGCQHVHAHNEPGTEFRMEGPNGSVSEILLVAAVD